MSHIQRKLKSIIDFNGILINELNKCYKQDFFRFCSKVNNSNFSMRWLCISLVILCLLRTVAGQESFEGKNGTEMK